MYFQWKKHLWCSFPAEIFTDQSWNCLINLSFSNLFWYYNTIFFHYHQNSFLDFFASKQKINKSLNFLICFDLPFPSFTYDKTFSFLGSVKGQILCNWLHFKWYTRFQLYTIWNPQTNSKWNKSIPSRYM